MGKKDALHGPPEVEGRAPQRPASPEVVSAAMDEAVASAWQDAPQEWALLDRVLDGSPIGIVVLDRELRFLRVNMRAAAMFGVDENAHAGAAGQPFRGDPRRRSAHGEQRLKGNAANPGLFFEGGSGVCVGGASKCLGGDGVGHPDTVLGLEGELDCGVGCA